MKPYLHPLFIFVALPALFAPPSSSFAEQDAKAAAETPARTATISGRVFNVATGYYLKNAEVRVNGTDNYVYTDGDGSYAITVPAGTVTLTASYSGASPATATTIAGTAPTILNFDLQPLGAGAGTDAAGPVVMLDRFEVTADREGEAKAIMDQRAANHAVTIIAADKFGGVTMGSVGEILKYMPGVTLEYGESEATGARIGGLPAKYTTAALDGVAISTSGRAVDLTDLTATGIETIEFVHTLTASMDAGAAAGRLNFVSRNPFSRRNRSIVMRLGLNAHGTAFDWGGSYLPDDRKHNLVFPSAAIYYGDIFLKRRLSIETHLSYDGSYNLVEQHFINHAYRNPGAINPHYDYLGDEPVIVNLKWRPYIQLFNRYGGNLNLGYKLSRDLTFTVRGSFFQEDRESYTLNTILRAYTTGSVINYSPSAGIDRINSTLTHWVVNGTGGSSTRLINEYAHRKFTTFTRSATPRLTFKRRGFSADLYGGYAGSTKRYRDTADGFFYASNSYLSNVGWTADRPSTDSPTWTLTQTSGDPWTTPENWSKRDYYSGGIVSWPLRQTTNQYVGGLDLAYARRVLGVPVTFKAGGLFRRNDYNYRENIIRYNYLGPTGRPQEAPLPYSQNYLYDFSLNGKAGNINDQGWRVDDTYAMYDLYKEHPDWFAPVTLDNLRRKLTGQRELTEDIAAGYVELNARVNRLRVNLGARVEDTEVETAPLLRRTDAQVIADGYDPKTEDGLLYQYHNGRHIRRVNRYSNVFLSGGLKYDLTANLQAQVSASQSIMRPDYANLAGVVNYDEEGNFTWVPNATLKPEYMTKFYAGINWRLEPAGTFSLYAYRMDIKNKQIRDIEISKEDAERIVGYPLVDSTPDDDGGESMTEDDGDANIFRTTINSASRLSVYGLTLEYNQQLTFLPGWLQGLSVFSSATFSTIRGVQTASDRIGQVKKSANGGFRYRFGRAHVQLRGTWQDSFLVTVTRPVATNYYFLDDRRYEKARFIVDLSGGFKLTPRYELTFSIRNLTNTPRIWYSNTPDRLAVYWLPGTICNVSLKGSF
jgi:TonB-dependent receptor